MVSTHADPTTTEARQRLRTAGGICVAGGLLGVAQAAIIAVWPKAVDSSRYSYPFHATGFVTAQATLCVQHLLLVVGLGGLLLFPAIRASRAGRIASIVAIAGMALLAIQELVAISAANVANDSSRGELIDNLYAVPVLIIAGGLIVAGIAAHRSAPRTSPSWLPVLVIVTGVYAIVPMSPAIAGPWLIGRIALGGWMLLFTGIGCGLIRAGDTLS